MSKYVYYVNVGKMPKAKADEYLKEVETAVWATNFFYQSDKLLVLGVRGDNDKTRIEWLGD